jgi:copper homeostasis protein
MPLTQATLAVWLCARIISMSSAIKLEICTASVEDCVKAERGGADRVELNCALMLGGLTPSLGALRQARASVRLPIIAMIRPRPAGFCYSRADFAVMQRDAEMALSENADGIAFGILTSAGAVDLKRCRQMVKLAAGRQAVFHRAFDVVRDPRTALAQLMDLGVARVMTSGQEASAYNGAANIAGYIRQAAGRIEILPAGGINRFTVADVIARTGCDQVHASLSTASQDRSATGRPQVSFGGTVKQSEVEFTVTDAEAVRRLRDALAR